MSANSTAAMDTIFEMATSNLRFGPGATAEIGMDLSDLGAIRVLVVTDPVVSKLPPVETARASLEGNGIDYELYDRVHVEPTSASFQDAMNLGEQLLLIGWIDEIQNAIADHDVDRVIGNHR